MTARTWQGFFYDGRTADRRPVSVTIEQRGLRLHHPDGSSVLWFVHELRQTQGSFSKELVRLERGDSAEAVLVEEPGFVEAIIAAFPGMNRTLRARRATERVLAWSGGVIAAAIVAYVWGMPLLATQLAERVPPTWESALGAGAAQRMAPVHRRCANPEAESLLRGMLDRLVAAGPKPPYDFTLAVVHDTVVNAFAAPGGFIALHSGLIQAARSPEEVAGVMAHEVQHVLRRHATRAVIREAPMRFAIASLGSGTGLESAAQIAGTLGALRYRREDEAEADREGMRMLVAAEVDPSGMVSFMETLRERSGGREGPRIVSYLSSHPQTADRVAQLAAIRAESQGRPRPLMNPEEWERLRGICGDGIAP